MSWEWLNQLSTFIRDFGVGIGAIIGAFFGGKIILPVWWKNFKRTRYKNKWKKRFSRQRFEDDFDLYKLSSSNRVYAVDFLDESRRWIRPGSTLSDLGYDSEDVKVVTKDKLEKYLPDRNITFVDDLSDDSSKPKP